MSDETSPKDTHDRWEEATNQVFAADGKAVVEALGIVRVIDLETGASDLYPLAYATSESGAVSATGASGMARLLTQWTDRFIEYQIDTMFGHEPASDD